MKKVFRLLFGIIDALIDVAEDKTGSYCVSLYGARDKLEVGEISIQDYNAAFEPEKDF